MKNLQISVGKLYASEFCRCYTTADLMNLGMTAQQSKELTFYVYEEAKRYENTMKLVDAQLVSAENVVMVIHVGFSVTPKPAPLNSLLPGDAAIFQLLSGQSARYVTTVKVAEWTELGL